VEAADFTARMRRIRLNFDMNPRQSVADAESLLVEVQRGYAEDMARRRREAETGPEPKPGTGEGPVWDTDDLRRAVHRSHEVMRVSHETMRRSHEVVHNSRKAVSDSRELSARIHRARAVLLKAQRER
jgi:hypothetical protein